MYKQITFLFLFLAFVFGANAQCPGPSQRQALINLQRANEVNGTRWGQMVLTDTCGNQRYVTLDSLIIIIGDSLDVTADNGLTENVANNIQLGGSLLHNTTITSATDASWRLNVSGISTSADGAQLAVSTSGTDGYAISGTSTGTGRGVYGVASGAGTTYGVYGEASGTAGSGVVGLATADNLNAVEGAMTGNGGYAGLFQHYGSNGYALYAANQDGWGLAADGTIVAGQFNLTANSDDVQPVVEFYRSRNSGTYGVGTGGSLDYYLGTGIAPGQNRLANQIISEWTDATDGTRTSKLTITGVNSATTQDQVTISGSGSVAFNNYGLGNFTGTPTYYIATDASGNLIEEAVPTAENWYNSNGTTTINTRIATVTETATWLSTDGQADGVYPFRFELQDGAANEPEMMVWKFPTAGDSLMLKQSDQEITFHSSNEFLLLADEWLIFQADSILLENNSVEAKTKVRYILAGTPNNSTVKKIDGDAATAGDIIVSDGTDWIVAPITSYAGNGIYGGNGTIPDNTVATATANGDFQIAYDGGNPGFEIDDAINQAYISGKDGTYAVYADNTEAGLTAGTATWTAGSDYALTGTASVANTNTAADRLIIKTNSTGTATTNFGGSILFQGESSTTDDQDMVNLSATWSTATHASRTAQLVATGAYFGVLSPMFTATPINFTGPSLSSWTIANGSAQLTVGGAGALILSSTSTSSVTAVRLSASGNNTGASGTIGNTSFTTTSGDKYDWRVSSSYAPTSGTGTFRNMYFNGTINQTGGANGETGAILFDPTLTAIGSTWSAIAMATSNSAAKFLNQTGASTTSTHVGAFGFGSTTVPTDKVEVTGNIALLTAGNKLKIATGANASVGTATLSGGTITVNTTAVTANSIIFLTYNTTSGTTGDISAPSGSIVAGTSFVINSTSGTDASTVNWWIIN